MNFEWDESKNNANLLKHGIAFADVTLLFEEGAPLLVDYDDREEYGEDRWIGIGALQHHVVVIVFTEPGPKTLRIISARRANRHERTKYFNTFDNRLGTTGSDD